MKVNLRFLWWRWAALRNGFQDALAYRWDFFFEVLGSAAVPACVQIVLWYALFNLNGAEQVQGYTFPEMISYTVTSVLFSQVRGGNHDFDLQEMIRSGQLSQYLLRPVGAVEFVWIRGVSAKLIVAFGCLLIGLAVSHFFGISPLRLMGGMVLALIGNIIHYQIGAALASTAFYWEEAFSVLMVKNMLVDLLSGELVPLFLFPKNMEWIWKYTPFYLYVYGPTQFSLGRWSVDEFCFHLGIAVLWLLMGWALVRITWAVGMSRYLSLGG